MIYQTFLRFCFATFVFTLICILSEPFWNWDQTQFYRTLQCNPFIENQSQFSVVIDGQTYPRYLTLSRNKTINFKCLNSANKLKVILLWNKFFAADDYGFGLGQSEVFINNMCPVVKCEITNNKSRLKESDIVITHMRNKIDNLTSNRDINQRWIFFLKVCLQTVDGSS